MIEQCSYDGTIYSARTIIEKLGPLCDYILFDEAWAGFMKFHPIYRGRFAMGLEGLDAVPSRHHRHPVRPTSNSSAFSQSSQIHVQATHTSPGSAAASSIAVSTRCS